MSKTIYELHVCVDDIVYFSLPLSENEIGVISQCFRNDEPIAFPTKDGLIVFRNEDNLFYFKVDSSDVAAHAARLATDNPDGAVLVKYYGVRMALFSSYPNALSLKEVPPDYTHTPWVSMVYLIVLLGLFIWAGVKVRRMFATAKEKFSKKPPAR